MAETIRAGIEAVPKGQMEAARSLGMSHGRAMATIVIPQALRIIVPPLTNELVLLIKDTSLVSVIAVSDLAYTAMQLRSRTFRILEMLTAMALIYWAMGYPQAKITDWIHRRMAGRE